MNALVTAEVCDRCGVREGDIGNWRGSEWVSLGRLFDEPMLKLPVPVRLVQLREVNGQMVCQRCAGSEERP